MGNWRSDLRVKVGTFNRTANAASGAVSYTGVGFRPRAIAIMMGNTTSNIESSIGISDGSKDGMMLNNANARVTVDDLIVGFDNDSAGTATQTAVLTSFDSDGFTLTWTLVGSPGAETLKCYYLALG